ncbi:oxygen-insensitive NADPH nitroreductase [Bacillus norwichensis]|uniref:Oxygen-insensitive NADPH nitroreductase n=1 Tax=Bacillus norwichensis TaxID=2762217 RepID=A0ABR8VLL0_9BACI|nr:oxygen-insensitive NADPH nitroreductase [Bacillus norwichensis]MBD8005653.1 oxygen-insensitive NADPH nitroreductase [Bacillus norwichensis]
MLDLLRSHASVRKYKDVPISDETFHEMLHAAQHAASSNFVQAYSVIRVKDQVKRAKLAELSKNQQYDSAALALVFCADLKRLEHAAALHGKKILAGATESFLVAAIDTALFAQNFVVAVESKGYGICYIGGVRNNPGPISDLLGLPDHVIPLFGMTVGVPDEANEVKPRLPITAILHEDTYDEDKYDDILKQYDSVMKEYYHNRSSNNKSNGWTDIMAAFLSAPRRTYMLEFLQSKGFLKN